MTGSRLGEVYDPTGAHLQDPYPLFERARRSEPVFYSARLQAWVVTRYDDVDAILKDPGTFSSTNSLRPVGELYPATFAELAAGYPPTPDHVTSDGAAHHRLRAAYAARLTAGVVRTLEPVIRARAESLIEEFVDDRRVELVSQFASRLPMEVVAELFGIAAEDVPAARSGTESLFQLGNAALTAGAQAQAAARFVALQRLLAGYIRDRRAAATGDLISHVVAELAPGDEPLTAEQEAELVNTVSGTIGAGHITTTHTITIAVRWLLTEPEQWSLLRQRPDLVPNAVEETLRFDAPVATIFRRCTRPAALGSTTIPADSDVLVVFASANRDGSHFREPDRFDVTRPPSRHFAFGAGPHTCLGAALARAQARIALRVLTERLPQPRLVPGQPIGVHSFNLRGPQALRLHW